MQEVIHIYESRKSNNSFGNLESCVFFEALISDAYNDSLSSAEFQLRTDWN